MQVGKAALLLTSRDVGVQQATKLLQKEKQADWKKLKPLNFTQKTFTTIPEASRGRLVRTAKKDVEKEDIQKRLAHAATLKVQVKFTALLCEESALVWSRAIQSSPSSLLKSTLNAAQDVLPHNANLALWRKDLNISDKCKLCGERQTLVHILNCCPVALKSRRYNSSMMQF